MFALNIQNENVYFKDIKLGNLVQILEWYNKIDDFKYATGIDTPISLEELTKKYAEVAICSTEIFVGIYSKNKDEMIGILKGSLKYENKDAAWISSLVIDTMHQHKGYGRAAMNLLLYFLKVNNIESVYLAVIEENIQGRTFWIKQDFKEMRKIERHLKLLDKQQNVIIMHRKL